MAAQASPIDALEANIDNLGNSPHMDKKAAKRAAKEAKKALKAAEGKSKGGLIVKLLAVVLVASIFASFWFNVFGIRDNYLFPLLENIPIVNNLLPVTEEYPFEGMTNTELISQIEALQRDIELREDEVRSLTDMNNLLANQVDNLTQFRDRQAAFREAVALFDEMVVDSAPVDFARFFESIDPEHAATLYQYALQREARDRDFNDYVAMIQAMEARAAADMLSRLIRSNPDLVASVLRSMDNRISGEILSAMTPQDSSLIVNRMYPENPPAPQLFSPIVDDILSPDAPVGIIADENGDEEVVDEEAEE